MIRLFTGLPGSFKTCRAVRVIREAIAAGRPVFVTNLEGLNVPGVQLWADPNDWQALPQGALLVVDEAQQYWRTSRASQVPEAITAMETHRHKGIDFLLTTQQPGYLLKHLRDLVGEHVHHIRNGKMRARTLTWNRCCVDLTSSTEAKKADVGFFIATPDDFTYYTSTVKDTHKPRINRRHILLGVAAVAILTVFGVAGKNIFFGKDEVLEKLSGVEGGPPAQQPGRRAASTAMTPDAMLDHLRPRIAPAPWSAPVFDEREAVSEPELYCISGEPGLDANGKYKPVATVTCLTEQGTRYELDPRIARKLAQSGPMYNPYREPRQQQQQPQGEVFQGPAGAGWNPASMAAPAAAPLGATPQGSEQQAAYGQFRAG